MGKARNGVVGEQSIKVDGPPWDRRSRKPIIRRQKHWDYKATPPKMIWAGIGLVMVAMIFKLIFG